MADGVRGLVAVVNALNAGLSSLSKTASGAASVVKQTGTMMQQQNAKTLASFQSVIDAISHMVGYGGGGGVSLDQTLTDLAQVVKMLDDMKKGKIDFNGKDLQQYTETADKLVKFIQTWGGKEGQKFNLDMFKKWLAGQGGAAPGTATPNTQTPSNKTGTAIGSGGFGSPPPTLPAPTTGRTFP